MKDRANFDYRMDNIRAIAILLVVFAHSVIIYDPGWTHFSSVNEAPVLRDLKSVFAMVHMPVFTFISGYLFRNKPHAISFGKLFIAKVKRILVPYLVFALLWMIPVKLLIGFKPYVNTDFFNLIVRGILLGQNTGHLWYCPFIFMAYLVTYLLFHALNKLMNYIRRDIPNSLSDLLVYAAICVFALIIYRFGYFSDATFPGISELINRFSSNYLWFSVGLIAGVLHDKSKLCTSHLLVLLVKICSAAGFCLFLYLFFEGGPKIPVLIGLLCIIMLYSLIPSKPIRLLSAISKNSFGIYLFHSPFVYITFTFCPDIAPILVLILNFFIFGGLSYFATSLLRKTPLRFAIGE